MTEATLRPYDPANDKDALWNLKTAFERGLGTDPEKTASYEAKLDDSYRESYLTWVKRCVNEEPCVRVAEVEHTLVGYVFLLPASLAHIWDAAVVNEVFVVPRQRGTGLADELMTWAIDHARGQSLPMDRLVLDVDRENARARAFYDRHGFSHWGEIVARQL